MEDPKIYEETRQQVIASIQKSKDLRKRLRVVKTDTGQTAIIPLNTDSSPIKRQFIEGVDDIYTDEIYATYHLIKPSYLFSTLYTIYEESDVLQECVEAYCLNIDGFGYTLLFLGKDQKERDSAQAQKEYQKAKNFFDYANESESWMSIRKKMRKDYEVLGNAGFEIIRNKKNQIAVAYHVPFDNFRMTMVDTTVPVVVKRTIKREGRMVDIDITKYYRRFAQIRLTGEELKWFKQFGDPRIMNAKTGKFVTNNKGELIKGEEMPRDEDIATEILYFKQEMGSKSYGIPRWMGIVCDVKGRRCAQYINYDLFNNQGIPPIMITVSGGRLTDESIESLEALVRGARGVDNWNKIVLLESELESVGLEEKGTGRIELKNMSEYRKEDLMFDSYIKASEKSIRHKFRLPPLYVGASESFCVSEDTETLTERGWKKYWEIEEDEKIATLNPDTNELEYHLPIDGLHIFPYKGDMYLFENDTTNMLVTPNHKMYTSSPNGETWKKVEAKDVFPSPDDQGCILFKTTIDNFVSDPLTDADMQFLHNWLYANMWEMQRPIDSTIIELITKISTEQAIYTLSTVIPKRKDNNNRFIFLKPKYIKDIYDLPFSFYHFSPSKSFIDYLQILIFKCGYRGVNLVDPTSNPVPVYGISASLGVIDTVLIKSEQKTVPYEGKVYCFEVPNHLFITRRNGKIGIHGNTHSTSKNARQVSEEQLFIPERIHTDEIIQGELVVRELGVTMWEYKSLGPRIVGAEEISAGVSSFANAGAFSINHAIERANEAFGLSMSKYTEAWADYPIPIVLKLVEQGQLSGLEALVKETSSKTSPVTAIEDQILKSDMFTQEEKDQYRKLMTIQHAVAKAEEI